MKAMNITVESFDDNIDTYIESKDGNPKKEQNTPIKKS